MCANPSTRGTVHPVCSNSSRCSASKGPMRAITPGRIDNIVTPDGGESWTRDSGDGFSFWPLLDAAVERRKDRPSSRVGHLVVGAPISRSWSRTRSSSSGNTGANRTAEIPRTARSGVTSEPGSRLSTGDHLSRRGRRYTGRVRVAVAEDVPVSDRRPLGGVSQFLSQCSFRADPLACKLLILNMRRDVRVVEGARLEIALAVCDGVLQISITVAKPTT